MAWVLLRFHWTVPPFLIFLFFVCFDVFIVSDKCGIVNDKLEIYQLALIITDKTFIIYEIFR